MADELKLGKYRHYKGKEYQVVAIARHSETLDEFVYYRALYYSPEFGENSAWVRPKAMFLEVVEHNGQRVPRFTYVDPDEVKLTDPQP